MIHTKIAIIAGHSSATAGKRTPPFLKDVDIDGDGVYDVLKGTQYREHYANVGVASKLDTALRRCGFKTLKVGWDDEDATNDTLGDDSAGLAKRQALVKAAECDISVAPHFNAVGDGASFNGATGVCTYIHSNLARVGDSAALAALVQAHLAQGTAQTDRGVHADAFAEVNCQAMGTEASVLVELAFMTNWEEASKLMANEAFSLEAAEEICRAICEYAGVAYIEREEDDDMVRYNTKNDIPNDYGLRDIVEKLMDARIIKGDGSDTDGNNDVIDLSHDQVRSIAFEYRGGAFDRQLMALGMEPAVQL